MMRSSDIKERSTGTKIFYGTRMKQILAAKRNEWGIAPYEADWIEIFTPIEEALWHDIRALGGVLYPQFPVGRFFVDFGNPQARVAIECDGAAFHTDYAKDKKRQDEIEAMGWAVYRFTGRDCLKCNQEIEDEDGRMRLHESATYRELKLIINSHGIGDRT